MFFQGTRRETTPFFPASGPATRSFNGLTPQKQFPSNGEFPKEGIYNTCIKQRAEPIPGTWYSDHYLDFLDAIRFGREPSAPIGSAHLSTTLCHLANIAIAVGRPLKWDGTRERFPDDPAANKLIDPPMRPPWTLES